MWDPVQYGRFAGPRSRAFLDLLAHVEHDAPRLVADLGCGSGELTALLAERWPGALVLGVDSSPEMLDRARKHEIPGRLELVLADISDLDGWSAGRSFDVLVANASLQWVPGHLELRGDLARSLRPGGVLAVQVPGNFEAPSHRAVRELCASPRWQQRVGDAANRAAVHDPATYLAELARQGLEVEAWETTYLHLLGGHDAVVEWLKGTTLRPVLDLLSPGEQGELLTELGRRLAPVYPETELGTILPFRRIFFVAGLHERSGSPRAR